MADVFLLIENPSEQRKIIEHLENAVAFLSDDELNVYKFNEINEAYEFIRSENKLDLAIVVVNRASEIDFLVKFRRNNPYVEFMLLADSKISPMEYLTPKIRASALLLTPYEEDRLKNVVLDFISDYYYRRENVSDEKMYVINTKNGKEFIPFSSIFYVEVREKRVYIRLQNREYSQFGTLESILEILPDYFFKCHRSYVFNTKFLSSVKFSENIIFLSHGINVPLSRSYKKKLKEYLSGTKS